MTLMDRVRTPADLRGLDADEVVALASEIRAFLVDRVCRTGGHLGPNLGVVELTLALHRVFDSPRDALIFDTGHQSYVHKILTGRAGDFGGLRQVGGLSGYPSRTESEHDLVENSHASTALSWADGLAKADALTGRDRSVVAVVGDGALTGGMCWEALNNIAAAPDRPVVIVVNDNGRSYSPTIGGLSRKLTALRLLPRYEQALEHGKRAVQGLPLVGPTLYSALHAAKAGMKDALSPQPLFADLGLKYLGPVDGHDVEAMEHALRVARDFGGPVVVHAVTAKGRGFAPAEADEADLMHSPGPLDPETGVPVGPKPRDWTAVFTESMLELGRERSDVVAITAAMQGPTGLTPFGEAFPERLFDVGIAEQHAMTSAAGLAAGGLHPVVAIYSTFLNRAFDQLLMDVALHRAPVTDHARPRRGHRQRRREPQRHVGPLDPRDRARPAGRRAPGRGDPARGAARGRRHRRRADRPALVEGRGARRGARAAHARPGRGARARRRPRRARPSVARRAAAHRGGPPARQRRARRPGRPARVRRGVRRARGAGGRAADRAGDRRHRRRPALGAARARGARDAGRRAPSRGHRRGRRAPRRRRVGDRRRPRLGRGGRPRAPARPRAGVPRPRLARPGARRRRASPTPTSPGGSPSGSRAATRRSCRTRTPSRADVVPRVLQRSFSAAAQETCGTVEMCEY